MAKQPKKQIGKDGVKMHTEKLESSQSTRTIELKLPILPLPDIQIPNLDIIGKFPSMPRIDILDKGDSFVIRVELPGVEEKDIDLAVSKQSIKITAKKAEEHESKGETYFYRETSSVGYERLVALPEKINTKSASADLTDGILHISVKKAK